MDRLQAIDAHFSPSQIKVTVKDRVALVEMNPPTKLIFLNLPLMEQLTQVIEQLEKDENVSAVILTGRGNSFATGANIMEMKD